MLINQTSTAIESFHSEKELVKTFNERVYDCIKKNGRVSRNEIQRETGLSARQVGCASWNLIKQGRIKVSGTKEDSFSKHFVECLVINFEPHLVFKKVSAREKLEMIRKLCDENVGQVVTQEIVNILSL